eukprot:TRINITY_DN774478_c0_g1_i1.p1 TRINITY_DN774478_c0_g1~~TRINITY_DN774478_c0_g1_i1.p1  ORF type:complete len:269 (-),score=113.29 TRINITY_DN774478_c0_g1_i1:250-1056(-)
MDLGKCLEIAKAAALAGAEVIKKAEKESVNVYVKDGCVDMVTDTDKASEKAIIAAIHSVFPEHNIIAEESWTGDMLTDEPTWFIDPLDGTTNYVHDRDQICVCVGLAVEKSMIVGAVAMPRSDKLYYAAKGMGSYCNDKKLSVKPVVELKKALVETNVPASRDPVKVANLLAMLSRVVLGKVGAIRMQGSATCQVCAVASGAADAFYEIGFGGPWDVAAAKVILEEAGGVVMDPSGSPFSLMVTPPRALCAATPELAEQLVELLEYKC